MKWKWSLACKQGACVLCRILHNPIHSSAHLALAHCQRQKAELAHCQSKKETISCTRFLRTGLAIYGKCLLFPSVWSIIVALIPIQKYLSCWRFPAGWGGDVSVTDTSGLTSAGCHLTRQRLTFVGCTKSTFVKYLSEQLTSFAPTNKESAWAQ